MAADLPLHILRGREIACRLCPQPCTPRPDVASPSAQCPMPRPRWIAAVESAPAKTGLGDMVAMVATPIARALRLPCIDPATKQLRPESGCAQRRAALNKAGAAAARALTGKP